LRLVNRVEGEHSRSACGKYGPTPSQQIVIRG